MDENAPETVSITGVANTETVLYRKKGLIYGIHTVTVSLPAEGTGLQVSYTRVYSENVEVETTVLPHTKTTGINNYFTFSNNWAAGNEEHT